MLLFDVNPLIYALREDVPEHRAWARWMESVLNGDELYSVSNATLTAIIRIATSKKVFKTPTPLGDVLTFIDGVRDSPAFVLLEPGPQHWAIMERLCRAVGVTGNLASDAYLAALALEADAELITADRDFARFPRLRFRHPLVEG